MVIDINSYVIEKFPNRISYSATCIRDFKFRVDLDWVVVSLWM